MERNGEEEEVDIVMDVVLVGVCRVCFGVIDEGLPDDELNVERSGVGSCSIVFGAVTVVVTSVVETGQVVVLRWTTITSVGIHLVQPEEVVVIVSVEEITESVKVCVLVIVVGVQVLLAPGTFGQVRV